MTRKEAVTIYIVPAIKRTWNDKICKEILEALKQETCGDAISREAVLSLPRNRTYKLTGVSKNESIDVDLIEALPSVTPEPKTGHWIIYDVHGHKACKCSECGIDVGYPCNDKYCPNCGCRMFEPQESDDEWDRVTMIDVNGNTHKVTFEKENMGDYPDEIPNQFDNLTGSMNL